jgi:hypothetical protein
LVSIHCGSSSLAGFEGTRKEVMGSASAALTRARMKTRFPKSSIPRKKRTARAALKVDSEFVTICGPGHRPGLGGLDEWSGAWRNRQSRPLAGPPIPETSRYQPGPVIIVVVV